jgi:hypothetical protein
VSIQRQYLIILLNFLFDAQVLANFYKCFKSNLRIELYITLELFKADRAQGMVCLSVALLCGHGAIHQALVVDAVLDAEHVSDLVCHSVTSTFDPNTLAFVAAIICVVKVRCVPTKRKDACA